MRIRHIMANMAKGNGMGKFTVVLTALYHHWNFAMRTMHPLLENMDGIKPYTIFFKNWKVNYYNPPTRHELDLFAGIIKDLQPQLVGLSVLSPLASVARTLTAEIRKASPSTLVIWGGVHPTVSPESCIREADMICRGEGESAIADLVTRLKEGQSCRDVKNIWLKNGDDIIRNPMRPLIQDLDSLPFPSYGSDSYFFIDGDRITTEDLHLKDNRFWIQTSRGCPYACSYCVNSTLRPLFRHIGPLMRRRSVGSVIGEIKRLLSLPGSSVDHIDICDEVFAHEGIWTNSRNDIGRRSGFHFMSDTTPKC